MKTFEVVLTKSYIVKIKADSESSAKEFSQIFTSDIKDLSTDDDKKNYNFEIESIDCKINEAFETQETYEND